MAPHQQRVVDEKEELDEKIKSLCQFINFNETFSGLDADEQRRLREQRDVMFRYSCILAERIFNFKD